MVAESRATLYYFLGPRPGNYCGDLQEYQSHEHKPCTEQNISPPDNKAIRYGTGTVSPADPAHFDAELVLTYCHFHLDHIQQKVDV